MSAPEEPAAGAQVAAFFDVDNTIVRGASAYHLAQELYRRDFFGLGDILFAARQSLAYTLLGENLRRIAAIQERALRLMRGHSVAEVISIGEEVYDEVLDHRIFPGTRALLQEHLDAGHEVWLITATPTEISDLLARRLGATGALGTRVQAVDGYYTGRLDGTMLHGAGKEVAVRELALERGIDLAGSFAYGDSINDVAIMSAVGHPCAINPEPRLRLHAAEAGWPVRDFRRRRRSLREDLRTGARSARWAGAAWAVSVVVRAVVRRLRARLEGRP
ncbi:HAD family hydrolase [Georgenia subflava]|uniref:HAD-IB family hydrolase n=1 Tax=Georgenia subflava TaxID=1622177 RepID=A0A6N7EJH7_9MICO|nr:HAD-IB family hydrolase [Georgenia subflava]MPV38240.1 HAD-IB family hydrolase [Georgenia subflava]